MGKKYIIEVIEDVASKLTFKEACIIGIIIFVFRIIDHFFDDKKTSEQNTSTKIEQVDKTSVNSKTNSKEKNKTKKIERVVQTRENVLDNDGVVSNIEEGYIDEVDFGKEKIEDSEEVEEIEEYKDKEEEYNTRKRRRRKSH